MGSILDEIRECLKASVKLSVGEGSLSVVISNELAQRWIEELRKYEEDMQNDAIDRMGGDA